MFYNAYFGHLIWIKIIDLKLNIYYKICIADIIYLKAPFLLYLLVPVDKRF